MPKNIAQTRLSARIPRPWLARSAMPVWTVAAMALTAATGMVAKEYAARLGVLDPMAAVDLSIQGQLPGAGLARELDLASDLTPMDGLAEVAGEIAPIEAAITSTDSHESGPVGATVGSMADVPVTGTAEIVADEPVVPLPAFESNLRVRWFNGRPVRPARTLTMVVTAYTPSENCCPGTADDLTASMHHVRTNAHRLVAADTRLLPLGSMITVPGYDQDQIVPVLDRGGAIKGHRLDVLFPSMREARAWGVKRLKVTVWEFADGKARDNYRTMRDGRDGRDGR